VAFIELILLYRFLKVFCRKYKCLALVLLFHGYILVYQFSSIREGIVIAILLGGLLPLLQRKKWIPYYILAFACTCIHTTAYTYLLLPLLLLLRVRWLEIGMGMAFVIGLIRGLMAHSISASAFILRVGICIALTFMFYHSKERKETEYIYKIVLFAFLLYFLQSRNVWQASKLFEALRYADIILAVGFMETLGTQVKRAIWSGAMMLFSFLLTAKNLDSIHGSYRENIRWWNYPYISVFHPESWDMVKAPGEE